MITFDNFTPDADSPIYLQIVRHIKRGIASGTVINGDELPSRRVLSALLGVNPNTVQKAYAILEGERLIESHTGAKSYVRISSETVTEVRAGLLESDATAIVSALKQMGLSKKDALSLIEKYWD